LTLHMPDGQVRSELTGETLQPARYGFEVDRPIYASDECEIDLARRELRILGSPVPVGGRAFEIIEILAESAGELVTKDELMHRIWPGAIVMDNTLRVHAVAIRKALGPYRGLLKTESGRGYRLLGSWTVRHQDATRQPRALQRVSVSRESPRTNFPASVTRLVGRAAAARRVRDLVSAYRVVTLTGPGGIGKSTLAMKVTRGVLGEFADGGWLVELASLSDQRLVPSAVASVLGLKISGETISAESVARAVGEQHLLLVLDNCEHVIDAVANLTEVLVRWCPRTTILATSREVLRIGGEFVYRVPPLEVPAVGVEEPDHILGRSAVELFIARTQALGSDFVPRAEDLPTIATICRRLDGIPLAIEFAAARAAVLGIQQVASGLRDRFALLTGGRRTALPRHRTLRATLDWSYALLSEAEQVLLRHLAVFPTCFTLDAAVAVTKDTELDASVVMDNIANLVSKSLVTLDKSDAVTRWSLLETIRAYAREKLAEHAETASTARYHAGYFRDRFALPALGARPRLSNDDLTRRVREIDNIRTALDWCFSADGDVTIGVHLTAAYASVWLHLSLIGECRDRCERALSYDSQPEWDVRLQMELQIALASALIVTLGSPKQIATILAKALEIADAVNDLDAQARALAELSTVYIYHRDYERARTALERLRQVAEQIGDPGIVAATDERVGTRLLTAGRLREAQQCFEHILETPLSPEDQRPEFWNYLYARAMARAMLARALCLQGFAERARQEARTSVDEVPAKEHPLTICRVLNFGICRVASMTGYFEEAEQAIAHSIEVATRLNAPFWQIVGLFLKGKLLVDRHEFAEGSAVLRDAFDKCGQNGWRISYPEFKGALAAAHAGLGQTGEALDAVNEAIADSGAQHGQMWYLPELLRVKGEVLLQQGSDWSVSAAEVCFDQAGEMAREQGALFWELRVALSLARLRMTQGRRDEARRLLVPVYDRFTEGFDTINLREAKTMLDALRP
jgi:predicted ATPase/DNA-binding winged helix-turn-helix (wHTH) protein